MRKSKSTETKCLKETKCFKEAKSSVPVPEERRKYGIGKSSF
jgi:hypothetical protein